MLIVKGLRFARGRVRFQAEKGFLERFINLCTAEGLPLWAVLVRLVPGTDKGILGNVLGIMTVLQVGQCQPVYRRPGAVVKGRQGIPVPGGQASQQPFQLLRIQGGAGLSRHCRDQHQHSNSLLSIV